MKVVVAMDSFKGSLSAPDACEAVRTGLLEVAPSAAVVCIPMADGGEGTADAMIAARGGEWVAARVTGPLPGMEVKAGYAWFADNEEALVEMAAASGLTLLRQDQLNPLLTTTYGTGQLVQLAMTRGARRILLAVGGSATVDGGVGAAQALGWSFRNVQGVEIAPGGGALREVEHILPPAEKVFPPVEVLCDVDNPLCGERGAAAVYGPQKGATPEMVAMLDTGLAHLAAKVKEQHGIDIATEPGGGAAGGLAAGAMAFMHARLVPGIETVMRAVGLYEELKDADWVITGEGRFDAQSLRGKVVSGMVKAAKATNAQVAVLAGSVEIDKQAYQPFGIEVALATRGKGTPLSVALENAQPLLREASRQLGGMLVGR